CNINRIRLVHAPQMYGMYMLRGEEMKLVAGRSVQEKLLFHVTTESRAIESLDSGLDWRRTHRNKFGRGVSFSDDADYANYYADNSPSEETRVIIVCTVLVSKTYVVPRHVDGNSLTVPLGLADTTVSDNSRVYVKYNDNEFYPLYFVYYRKRPEHMTNSKYFRSNTRRAMGHYDRRTIEERYNDHLDATGYYDDDDTFEQMCSDFKDAMDSYYEEHDD
ncbi:poly [ADP-ribose] polymerase 12-like, partial [Myzus persicae]|uniref:poly [ADP-ribose] polymerase 12-like n=1 Tax=Myzus persicae TaxID=13164 RepID=UPI000B92FEFB